MKKIISLLASLFFLGSMLTAQIKAGVVSFTFRTSFEKNVEATLDSIKAMGITDIEFSNLFGKTAEEMRRLLDARGLTCSSYGVGYPELTGNTETVGKTAKILGASFVRVAWIPHDSTGFTEAVALKAAEDFNKAGKVLKEKFDLRFCYHNHGYEFASYGQGTFFDLIADKTIPQYVGFEMDILWVYFPGKDPVALLNKYGKRFFLMHLKDLKPGVARNPVGGTSGQNNVPLGQGQLDIPAILNAAKKAGIRHYYIEDESDRVFTQVPESLAFLKSIQ